MDTKESQQQFLQVIESHKGIIYKVARSYCNDLEDRKDLCQEIIIQLWKSFENYNDTYKYSTWMYRISLNVAISFFRKESTRSKISQPFTDGIFIFTDTEEMDHQETNLKILQGFISEMKELDKALTLLFLEEKSYREIAQIIGISESNVSTKMNRIKNSLKLKFAQLQNQ